jgi:hypothetical protein
MDKFINNAEQIEQAEGNIQTSALIETFTSQNNGFQSKNYFFTYHINQSKQTDCFKKAFALLENLKSLCVKFCWGEEYGDQGKTPHIQGCFVLKKKEYWKKIEQAFFTLPCPFGKRLKSWEGAKNYCIKECNEIHFGGFEFEKPLKTLACENNFRPFQEYVIGILNTEPDDRTIHWLWGNGNIGKTTFCKWIFRNYKKVIVLGGKNADMKNAIIEYKISTEILPEIVLINLPKGYDKSTFSYTGVEEVKDMFFYSGKFKGGMVDGNNPHVIIFSNDAPKEYMLSADRWKIFHIIENF